MVLFKVWSFDRQERKLVVADSLKVLEEKAKVKLNLTEDIDRIVLEEDGTIVDDDEILSEVCDKTLIVLTPGQSWKPQDACILTEITPNIIQVDNVDQHDDNLPVLRPNNNEVNGVKENIAENSQEKTKLPQQSRNLLDLPVPDFSFYVKQCLRNKESGKVWNKAVDEAANYYLAFYPNDVDNQKAYRIIGQKICQAFPDIKREGELPWSTFTRALSQKMRAQRLSRKRKSTECNETEVKSKKKEETPKKFRSSEAPVPVSKMLSEDDYESHISEIKKECVKNNSNENHIQLLLRESFFNRRDWIKNSTGGKVQPVFEKFPCFEYGKFIWTEFKIIMEKELQLEVSDLQQKLEDLLAYLGRNIPKKDLKECEYKVPSLIRFLEKETAYDKGRGEKSASFITIYEDIDEKDVEKLTKSHQEEGPRLVLFLKGKDHLEMSVIPTDTCRIYCQAKTIIDSLLILIGTYYVFHLDYPRKYTQCLGFLQQIVLGDAFTGDKSTKFKHFLRKFQKDLK